MVDFPCSGELPSESSPQDSGVTGSPGHPPFGCIGRARFAIVRRQWQRSSTARQPQRRYTSGSPARLRRSWPKPGTRRGSSRSWWARTRRRRCTCAARASAARSWGWRRSTRSCRRPSQDRGGRALSPAGTPTTACDGILVQLPLPGELDSKPVLELIDPAKDVDGFHPVNVGQLVANQPGLRSCTPAGVMELLRAYDIPVDGRGGRRRRALGHRRQAGGAAARCTRTPRSRSPTRAPATWPRSRRRADILVAAVGRPEMVTGDMIKPGAVVIDVGINRTDAGLVGDVRLRVRVRGRRRDHAGAGRRRPDDDRDAAVEHVEACPPPL